MDDAITNDLVISPSDDELGALRELDAMLDSAEDVVISCGRSQVSLHGSIRDGIERLVSYLAGNVAVAVQPYGQVITTQDAADLLGMSRPHLVSMLENGTIRIPFETVGQGPRGHRRLRLSDVLAYRDSRAADDAVDEPVRVHVENRHVAEVAQASM